MKRARASHRRRRRAGFGVPLAVVVAAALATGTLGVVRAGGATATAGNASAVFVLRADVTSTGAQSVGPSNFPTVSADGRYIGFTSAAQDLVSRSEEHTSE